MMKSIKHYVEQQDTLGVVQMNMKVDSSFARWPLMWFGAIFKSCKLSSNVLLKMDLALEMNIVLPRLVDIAYILPPLSVFFLWSLSLQHENVGKMNDLGMVSTFPPSIIIALIILTVSFCLALRQPRVRTPMLLLHLVLLILMLYGIENLVEEAPRFAVVYRHAGYTEYIMRTGYVNPNLDAYFSWPGFFVLAALVTQLAGYHDILSYAGWAPAFYNLIYAGPLYMIFTSASADKRLAWLGLWFFYLTNWVGQDYFSPQGLNFFLYLAIMAILLKWFKAPLMVQSRRRQRWQWLGHFSSLVQRPYEWLTATDILRTPLESRQRTALMVILLLIFACVVYSHPLTPFFVLASTTALVLFRRCTPRWLPLLMALMIGLWLICMAQTFLAGHPSMVFGDLGQAGDNLTASVTQRVVQGNLEHTFIAAMRVIMTGFIWLLACLGGVRRMHKGRHDITYILLAVAAFPLIMVQQYGGEMFLRIYLFTLPLMVFFAATFFYTTHRFYIRGTSPWMTVAILCTNLVLLGGFLFTHYGNERVDYMTYAEVAGVRYLYNIAPSNSLLIGGWDGTPWQFQDYEKYTCYSMASILPDAVVTHNVDAIVRFIESQKHSAAYMVFTRSQKAWSYSLSGLSAGSLDQLEDALLKSRKFKMIYSNADAQVFIFIEKPKGSAK